MCNCRNRYPWPPPSIHNTSSSSNWPTTTTSLCWTPAAAAASRSSRWATEPGAISAPPVLLGDYLLVAVNRGGGDSSLVVLKIQSAAAESTPPLRLAQTIPLQGHVDAAPSAADGRVAVATDAGAIHVFQPAPADAKEPLAELCAARLPGSPGLIPFPLLRGDTCFLAADRLTSLEVHPADKQLAPAWTAAADGAAAQPPVAIGQTIFHVCHAAAAPGVVVSAVSVERGTPYWQTTLAAPPAAAPLVDAERGKVTLATALGGIYPLDAGNLAAAADAAPLPPPGLRRPLGATALCDGGRLVLSGGAGSDQVLVAELAQPGRPPRTWCLPGPLSCPPLAFAGGLLRPRRPARCICWIRFRARAWPHRSSPGCKPGPCRSGPSRR